MRLRTLFIFLVLVNLVFFAWGEGYFGAADDGREPQRLGQQLAAEKLRVLGSTAPGEKPPAQACRLIDGLVPADAQRLRNEAQAREPNLKITSRPSEVLSSYWVLIPPLPDRAAAEKKLAELKRLGVSGYQLIEEEGALKLAIVLGAFRTEPSANEFLQALGQRGVRSARLQALEKTVVKVQLTVQGAAASLDEKLRALLQSFSGAALSPCVEAD